MGGFWHIYKSFGNCALFNITGNFRKIFKLKQSFAIIWIQLVLFPIIKLFIVNAPSVGQSGKRSIKSLI